VVRAAAAVAAAKCRTTAALLEELETLRVYLLESCSREADV